MAAIAAFASSDTGQFLYAMGIELPLIDPLVCVNLKAASAVMANRADAEPSFEEKYG